MTQPVYTQLTRRTALRSSGPTDEFSAPIGMNRQNAVLVSATVFALSGTTPILTIVVQGSNDLQNWEDYSGTGASTNATSLGYWRGDPLDEVVTAYVRLRYLLGADAEAAIFACGVCASYQ